MSSDAFDQGPQWPTEAASGTHALGEPDSLGGEKSPPDTKALLTLNGLFKTVGPSGAPLAETQCCGRELALELIGRLTSVIEGEEGLSVEPSRGTGRMRVPVK